MKFSRPIVKKKLPRKTPEKRERGEISRDIEFWRKPHIMTEVEKILNTFK
jgi:hypothetical protein